jgi:hypothetical protein
MKRIKNFVKNTFKDYPKPKRDQLIEEITQMLIEKVEDLVDHGMELDQAINKTVTEFGTIDDFEEQPQKVVRKLKVQKTLKHYRNDIILSFGGFVIISGMLIFTDLVYTSSNIIWFVIPVLALLWWPLATIYRYLNKKETIKGEKDE